MKGEKRQMENVEEGKHRQEACEDGSKEEEEEKVKKEEKKSWGQKITYSQWGKGKYSEGEQESQDGKRKIEKSKEN